MSKDRIRERFGALAGAYAVSRVHAQGESLARLVELVQPQPHWHALDVATGAGHTALAFAPHVAHVTATDITPQMLAETEQLAARRGITNVTTRIADAEALPFDDARFDLVTCRIAPHHFGDVERFLRESARVLRSDGVFALVDNTVPDDPATAEYINAFERIRDSTHNRCLSPTEWKQTCERAGFTVVHQEVIPKPMTLLEWAARIGCPAPVVQRVRERLVHAPAGVAASLRPRAEGDDVAFLLSEVIVISKRR